MRQTGNRPTDFRQGTILGLKDQMVKWRRHRNRCPWISRREFVPTPRVLLRELRVRVEKRGFRTKQFVVITTLLDAEAYPRDELAGLSRARWHAELIIRSIKQTLRMDVLRCKHPDLVRKEIWTHLLAYNPIRGDMAEAAGSKTYHRERSAFRGPGKPWTRSAWNSPCRRPGTTRGSRGSS
jgi:hypothetical protein